MSRLIQVPHHHATRGTTQSGSGGERRAPFCCLDCSKCDAYLATIRRDDALRAEVAARWKMKPDEIECLGCKSAKALFNCTLKPCATRRGLPTCAHCPDFETCKDEQWTRFPTLRETATRMRATLG